MVISSAFLHTGLIINNSYKIIKLIGQGGFGRTYLVELIATGEKRVLKEFAPQVSKPEQIVKAKELFNREVGTLQKLNHQQIPKFYELLQVNIEGENRLFFVQEYIEGNSYHGQQLSETEVIKFLKEILPVLSYIHQQNVIHRDLSPDNIIQRNQDQKPILIDFGAVKVASTQVYTLFGSSNQTRIGKNGYVPTEQILRGQAFPSSDIYALGVTAIVLLTGEDPNKLQTITTNNITVWHWETKVNINPNFAKILSKMIEENHFHRFQSAAEVLGELNSYNFAQNSSQTIPKNPTKLTVLASSQPHHTENYVEIFTNKIGLIFAYLGQFLPAKTVNIPPTVVTPSTPTPTHSKKWLKKVIIISIFVLLPGIITFGLGRGLINKNNDNVNKNSEVCRYNNEDERQKCIYKRAKELNLNIGLFYQEVDTIFYKKYPQLKGQKIGDGDSTKEVKLREEWCKIAEKLLEEKSKI